MCPVDARTKGVLMASSRTRRRMLLSIAVPILLLGALGCWAYTTVHRLSLNRPLVEAVKRSNSAAVKELLEQGADPDVRDVPARPFSWDDVWQAMRHRLPADTSSAPVLQLAVCQGNGDIARMLIDHRANVNATSDYWPVEELVERETLEASSPRTGGYTALMDAAVTHRADLARLLLEHGADPNLHPSEQELR